MPASIHPNPCCQLQGGGEELAQKLSPAPTPPVVRCQQWQRGEARPLTHIDPTSPAKTAPPTPGCLIAVTRNHGLEPCGCLQCQELEAVVGIELPLHEPSPAPPASWRGLHAGGLWSFSLLPIPGMMNGCAVPRCSSWLQLSSNWARWGEWSPQLSTATPAVLARGQGGGLHLPPIPPLIPSRVVRAVQRCHTGQAAVEKGKATTAQSPLLCVRVGGGGEYPILVQLTGCRSGEQSLCYLSSVTAQRRGRPGAQSEQMQGRRPSIQGPHIQGSGVSGRPAKVPGMPGDCSLT